MKNKDIKELILPRYSFLLKYLLIENLTKAFMVRVAVGGCVAFEAKRLNVEGFELTGRLIYFSPPKCPA